MSPGDAVRQFNSDKLALTLEIGDVRIVRVRRQQVTIEVLSGNGRWVPKVVLGEVEAADLNSKLDELLRQ